MQAARALADASLREGRAQSRLDGSLLAARKVVVLLSENPPPLLENAQSVSADWVREGGEGGFKKSLLRLLFFSILKIKTKIAQCAHFLVFSFFFFYTMIKHSSLIP